MVPTPGREELSTQGSVRADSSVSFRGGIKKDPAFIALVKRSERIEREILEEYFLDTFRAKLEESLTRTSRST